jgi:hypothetical protein
VKYIKKEYDGYKALVKKQYRYIMISKISKMTSIENIYKKNDFTYIYT